MFSATRTAWGCLDAQMGLSKLPERTACSRMQAGVVSNKDPFPPTFLYSAEVPAGLGAGVSEHRSEGKS